MRGLMVTVTSHTDSLYQQVTIPSTTTTATLTFYLAIDTAETTTTTAFDTLKVQIRNWQYRVGNVGNLFESE